MNEQENINLVKKSYELSFKETSQVTDDVEWETPGPSEIPTAGRFKGKEQAAQFFSKLANTYEPVSFTPQEFIAQNDKVVTLGEYTWRVKSNGRTFSSKWAHVSTIHDGKFSSFREYGDTAAAVDAIRGK